MFDDQVVHGDTHLVGDTVVALMLDGSELRLTAVDADDGTIRWSHPVSFEGLAPAITATFAAGEAEVFAMLATDEGPALSRIDAATGDVEWSASLRIAVSDVAWCHGSVCARSTYEEVAVDPVDGTVLARTVETGTKAADSGADERSVVVSDEEGRSLLVTDQSLRLVDATRTTVWETSYEAAFDGHPVDPENGYDVRSTSSGGWIVLLGPKLAVAEYEATPAGTRLPTSHVTVLGADGAVTAVWPDTYSCLDADAPIYCTGHAVRTEDGYVDRAEGVIAFDERNGSVAWEATFPAPIEVNGDPVGAVLADGVAVLGTHDHAVVLDLQEGTVREASGIVAWCRDEPVRDEIELWGEWGRWARAAQHHPCRMGGGGPSRGDELPPSLPSVVGHRHHDRWIWPTDGTLHAVPAP